MPRRVRLLSPFLHPYLHSSGPTFRNDLSSGNIGIQCLLRQLNYARSLKVFIDPFILSSFPPLNHVFS